MRAGDIVEVTAGALSASVQLIDMDGAVNAATNVVSGKLVGKPNADVRVEVWRDNGGASRDLKTDDSGQLQHRFRQRRSLRHPPGRQGGHLVRAARRQYGRHRAE